MASPSMISCLPQTLGISAACSTEPVDKSEEGAVGGDTHSNSEHHSPNYANLNGGDGAISIKTDPEAGPSPNHSPPPSQPLSPRLGPLANIDEDEHEDDFDDHRDDYCGHSSNTATLLLKDRKMNKVGVDL